MISSQHLKNKLLACLVAVSGLLGGQTVLDLSQLTGPIHHVEVSHYISAYTDLSGQQKIEDITGEAFVPLDSFDKPKGFLRDNSFRIWLRCRTVGNPNGKGPFYWFMGKEHSDIHVFFRKNGRWECFAWGSGENNPSSFLLPFSLGSGGECDWYFCIQSYPYEMRPITPQMYSQDGWFAQNALYLHEHRLPFNVLIGLGSVLAFMVIFSLVQFSIHKAPVYAFYALFLLSVMLNLYRSNLEILIPTNGLYAYLTQHGNKFSTYLGHLFYFWFVIYFLDLPKTIPRLYQIIRKGSFVAAGLLLLHFLLYYGFERHDWASHLYYVSRYVLLGVVAWCIGVVVIYKPPFFGFIVSGSILVVLGANWWMICGVRDSMGLLSPPYPNVVFYFSVLIETIIFVTGLGYKFRVVELDKRRAQEKLILERERISRDLHDDVGATLNSLALLSEMAQRSASKDEAKTRYGLEQIHSISRDTILRMSDIVWAISPKNDALEDLVSRMRDFSQRLFADSGVRLRYELPDDIATLNLSEESRWNIFLIFKEALTNVQKYASATSIYIRLAKRGRELSLSIRDNGQGFDPSEARSGNGLHTMQERATLLGGQCQIRSKPGEGTEIIIKVPVK